VAGTRWRAVGITLAVFVVLLSGLCGVALGPGTGFRVAAILLVSGVIAAAGLPILYVGSVMAHEAGHVLAAAAVGIPIHQVHIGGGRPVLDLKVGRTSWTLAVDRSGGATVTRDDTFVATSRWRPALFTLGGPAASAVLGCVALLASRHTSGVAALVVTLVAISNLATAASSLIPRIVTSVFGTPTPSDGLLLRRLLWPNDVDQRHHAAYAALTAGDVESAALIAADLAERSADPRERATYLNLFAFAAIIDGSQAMLDDAARAIDDALTVSPTETAYLDTKALCLACAGDGVAARSIAEELVVGASGQPWAPSVTATLSLALEASGEHNAARSMFERARALDPDDLTVRFVERRLTYA
jgi:hypothetical protein